jgi:hypothetical protein
MVYSYRMTHWCHTIQDYVGFTLSGMKVVSYSRVRVGVVR